jgi:methyl-accepting chemotaxis protein
MEMDGVTQQNAALVEEAAAAAEALQGQSSHLAELVSVFQVDGGQRVAGIPPVAAKRAQPAPRALPALPLRTAAVR